MPFHFFSPVHYLHYYLKREATQFFTSIAIRSLAIGMVLIFEPIYLYLHFGGNLTLTLLFIGAQYMLYGLLAVYGGRIVATLGVKHAMLLSHVFFFAYYVMLFFLNASFFLVPLAIITKSIGMTLFWPAFHIDFARFSEKDHRGLQVGKLNVAILVPMIISPVVGGLILSSFGFPILFTIVLVVLFTSAIPLFLSKEHHEVYTDSYRQAWSRMLKKENRVKNIAFASDTSELIINVTIWPIFMFILAIGYGTMGAITSLALGVTALFALYIGKVADTVNRVKMLNIGSVLTAISWIAKYFVVTPLDAFLAHTLYRVFRTSAGVPFKAIFYDMASLKGAEADEFIIYREIVFNISQGSLLMFLGVLFFFIPQVNIAFLFAALFSLGFMFMGNPPKFLSNFVKHGYRLLPFSTHK